MTRYLEEKSWIVIQEMTAKDLDDVLQIEKISFRTPWSRELFRRELAMPLARSFVAREVPNDKLVGYLCFWLVIPEVHILNLAVHPERRRQGIGLNLLLFGLEYCRQKGAQEFTLEVRRSNYDAISLYRKLHFLPWGIRKGYYQDSGEDAVIMGLHLEDQSLGASVAGKA